MDDTFGAGHFAGSAALVRREVPPSVDGWSSDTLTEDIDFTVRLQLLTDWEVTYDVEMIALETTPENLRQLVRQRQRWTRGWAQVAKRFLGTLLRSPGRLGWRRSLGLSWLLFAAVSAPLATIFPALFLMPLFGVGTGLPLLVAVPLALYILPARGFSFGYATLRDPTIPVPARLGSAGKVVVYGYLWILFNWTVQVHSLYLELAGSPRTWQVTRKPPKDREATPTRGTNRLEAWYRNWIGRPYTNGEVSGYWTFVLGVGLGVLGVVLFFNSRSAGQLREWSIVFTSAALVLLIAGSVIRLPLRRVATWLTTIGMLLSAAAMAWFVVAFPTHWSTRTGHFGIIALYTAGVLVITASAVLVPLRTDRADLEAGMTTSTAKPTRLRTSDPSQDPPDANPERNR